MKKTKLYNVMFPIWLFFLYPTIVWLVILPVNFAVDSIVVLLSCKENKKEIWKKSILKVWLLGFASDFLGGAVALSAMLALEKLNINTSFDALVYSTIISIPAVIVAGILIYFLNKFFSFKNTPLEKQQIHRLCLYLAIFTAPYAMLIPGYL